MRFWLLYLTDGSAVCECGWAGGVGGVGVGSQALEQGVDGGKTIWLHFGFFLAENHRDEFLAAICTFFSLVCVFVFFFVLIYASLYVCCPRALFLCAFFFGRTLSADISSVCRCFAVCACFVLGASV